MDTFMSMASFCTNYPDEDSATTEHGYSATGWPLRCWRSICTNGTAWTFPGRTLHRRLRNSPIASGSLGN